MSKKLVPIKGHNYKKDLSTGVLINNDDSQYLKILELRKKTKRINDDAQKVIELQKEVDELKQMMLELIKKGNNG